MKNKQRKIKLRIPISTRAPKIEKSINSYSRRTKHKKNNILFGNNLSVHL